MTSRETDRVDRRQRERQLDANLAQARAGQDRLGNAADQPPPDRDQYATGTPNAGGRA
jgi:hypothetical protein